MAPPEPNFNLKADPAPSELATPVQKEYAIGNVDDTDTRETPAGGNNFFLMRPSRAWTVMSRIMRLASGATMSIAPRSPPCLPIVLTMRAKMPIQFE